MMNEEKDLWCNYSGMPSPMSYMRCDKCDEVQYECKCKEKTMNKEQQELLDEAYENYCISYKDGHEFYEDEEVKRSFTQVEFINKCKTYTEFSETWGLKIEERELSLEERMDLIDKMHLRSYSGWQNWSVEEMEDRMNNDWNIPTRLITVTYNNKTIESYE